MLPLYIGLIILIIVLTYHIIFNKEGFKDLKDDNELAKISIHTFTKLPAHIARNLQDKFNAMLKESNDKLTITSFNKFINLLEQIRPYYSYPGVTFDQAKIKLLNSLLKNTPNDASMTSEEKQLALLLIPIEIKKIQASIPSTNTASLPKTSKPLPKTSKPLPKTSKPLPKTSKPLPKTSKPLPKASNAISESGSAIMDKIRPLLQKECDNDLKNDVRRLVEKIGKSPSEKQGEDYNRLNSYKNIKNESDCTNQQNGYNNDDYIRKDSIPCWSCNLPKNNY
jgi:hypothetical protein